MRIHGWIVLVSMALATTAFADPPRHAPAHGHRAKHKHHAHKHHGHKHHRHHSHDDHAHDHHAPRRHGGVEVVFDPERGVSIAVGFPDIFFHADHFYRHHGGIWQMSERVDGGWKRAADGAIPAAFRKLPHPVPAKLDEGEDRPRHPKWRGKRR